MQLNLSLQKSGFHSADIYKSSAVLQRSLDATLMMQPCALTGPGLRSAGPIPAPRNPTHLKGKASIASRDAEHLLADNLQGHLTAGLKGFLQVRQVDNHEVGQASSHACHEVGAIINRQASEGRPERSRFSHLLRYREAWAASCTWASGHPRTLGEFPSPSGTSGLDFRSRMFLPTRGQKKMRLDGNMGFAMSRQSSSTKLAGACNCGLRVQSLSPAQHRILVPSSARACASPFRGPGCST